MTIKVLFRRSCRLCFIDFQKFKEYRFVINTFFFLVIVSKSFLGISLSLGAVGGEFRQIYLSFKHSSLLL